MSLLRVQLLTPRALGDLVRERLETVGVELAQTSAAIAVEVLWRLAHRTPVLEGRARGNWNLGVNRPDPTWDPDGRKDPSGAATEARARAVAAGVRLGDTLYVTNGAPYMLRLNDGWSKKAPAGFLEQTAAEVPFIAQAHALGMAGRLHGRGVGLGTPGASPLGAMGGAVGGASTTGGADRSARRKGAALAAHARRSWR